MNVVSSTVPTFSVGRRGRYSGVHDTVFRSMTRFGTCFVQDNTGRYASCGIYEIVAASVGAARAISAVVGTHEALSTLLNVRT